MIMNNSIVKMKRPLPNNRFTDDEFKVITISPETIVVVNKNIGTFCMNTECFYDYFCETDKIDKPNAPNTFNDPYEIETAPYSSKWTDWSSYTFPDGATGEYRYRDTTTGSVRLELRYCDSTGRATCHPEDEFDLTHGLNICRERIKIKSFKNIISKEKMTIAVYQEEIDKKTNAITTSKKVIYKAEIALKNSEFNLNKLLKHKENC